MTDRNRASMLPAAFALATLACGAFGSNGQEAARADAGAADAQGQPDATAPIPDGAAPEGKTVVAISTKPIPMLAVDVTRVIWSDAEPEAGTLGDIWACPKSGCIDGKPTLIEGNSPVATIASDGTTVVVGFASQSRGLGRLSGDVVQNIVPNQDHVYQSVVRDGTAYYVVFDEKGEGSRTLFSVPLSGGSAAEIGTYAPGANVNTSQSAVAAKRAFFGSHSTGNIGSCAIDTKICGDFVTGDDAFGYSLATDDERVFWANGKTLVSCAVGDAACVPRAELPQPLGAPSMIVVRQGALFMVMKSGDLLTCSAKDCASTHRVLTHEDAFDAKFSEEMNNVTVDDTAVFYVAHVGGEYRIMRQPIR